MTADVWTVLRRVSFARIGKALQAMLRLSLPPAASMAWRCPTCPWLLVDHAKLVAGRR